MDKLGSGDDPQRFAARVTPTSDGKLLRHTNRHTREVVIAVKRDGQPFQTFAIVVARSLLRSLDADDDELTARAVALVMEPTIKSMVGDGSLPAPTEIELQLTDEAALGAALRRVR